MAMRIGPSNALPSRVFKYVSHAVKNLEIPTASPMASGSVTYRRYNAIREGVAAERMLSL